MNLLFTPTRLGQIDLANRLIMAPMTRSRADNEGVVGEITATYYAQRATAGLIITEGVFPTPEGKGYVRTPGMVTTEQAAAWSLVAKAVHEAGGRIVMQMMHTGRISHPDLQPDGTLPEAPSAVCPAGQAWTEEGMKDFVTPRELSIPEIEQFIDGYRKATRLALDAGFDGVELHCASGYLPEQFLTSGSNRRDDRYGGPIENRARFPLEVLSAMIEEAGPGRVGMKLSPEFGFNDIKDENPVETYGYLVDQLPAEKMAYLNVTLAHSTEPAADYHALLKPKFAGNYIIGGGLTGERAGALLTEGKAEAVVFGAAYIANPDLAERLRRQAPLNAPDFATFYAPGPNGYADGYTDYPNISGGG